jgi:hypothetical protein
MLTLTYRENMLDRERIRRDVDVMLKRIRRVIPTFEYVCVFERQKRGAWHAHLACRRVQSHYLHRGKVVQSYALLRLMWHGAAGDGAGNIDVSRGRAAKRSTAKLAGYLSKYISKGFEDGQAGDSYSASGSLPPPDVHTVPSGDLIFATRCALAMATADYHGHEFRGVFLDGGSYFLSGSPP